MPAPQPSVVGLPDANWRAHVRELAISRAVTRLGDAFPDPCHLRDGQFNELMLGHLCTRAPVKDPDLLLYMIRRHVPFGQCPDMIGVSDRQLTEALLQQGSRLVVLAYKSLPEERVLRLLADDRLAAVFLRHYPVLFNELPEALQTASFLAPVLDGMPQEKREKLLRSIASSDLPLALSLAPVQEIVRIYPRLVRKLPQSQLTPELRRIAVSNSVDLLTVFKGSTDSQEYEELCELASDAGGSALQFLEADRRTPARVDKAVAHKSPVHLAQIPEELRNEQRLGLALANASVAHYCYGGAQLSTAFLTRWKLWDILQQKQEWLDFIAPEERSEALCCTFVHQQPVRVYTDEVPKAIRQRHPEWKTAVWQPDCAMSLSDQTTFLCRGLSELSGAELTPYLAYNSAFLHGQFCWPPAEDIAPWALVVEGFWDKLPDQYKQMIWHKGGTEGLGPALGAPPFQVEPQAFLDPVQEHHCTLRAARLPAQVAKTLMFCEHFQPRHERLGAGLRYRMRAQSQALESVVAAGQVPLCWQDASVAATAWKQRGGRTLVRTDAEGRVVHMKFQRQGETLASLAAEQAAQHFAHDHSELGWQSEIPKPQGMFRVPLEDMPVAPGAFPDSLQVHGDEANPYCLAFRFTTKDSDYDTLAWQIDEVGGDCRKAREGLLRAFHDLGIWNSLGAVHTSTIKLYHHFFETEGSRPELLFNQLFRPGQSYPGTLHLWNTVAIEQSDWGWSGLRDLGDLEFYPFIKTYVESVDAGWVLDGYGQRASFVNGMAQNILGGLLHYMRAHRELPDYHYKNSQQVAQLAGFLEEACNRYLDTLLDDGSRLDTVIPAAVYPEWLQKTAQEMIYWTARQTEDTEGFGLHFNRDGRPCAELYPGHPRLEGIRYGLTEDFTEEAGESLGTENGKLPLFYLMRGLYMMAALVADRLAKPLQPQSADSR